MIDVRTDTVSTSARTGVSARMGCAENTNVRNHNAIDAGEDQTTLATD
jgi:hypothetical protein